MALRRFTTCWRRRRGRRSSRTSATISRASAPARKNLRAPRSRRSGVTWERSPCLGLCDRAPAALVIAAGESPTATALAPVSTAALLDAVRSASIEPTTGVTHVGGSEQRLLRRIGRVDPESLDDYRAHGGFAALARARELGPDKTIAEIAGAKLLGRGGAAFPAAQKVQAVAAAPARPHYLVCNADESEPGTFKDRVLMEGDPFALVEAITIAAYAAGCEHAYVYVRGEYPLAARRLEGAIAQAQAAGLRLGNPSRSNFVAAPAPIFAARRPRSSTRSKASAANRAISRPFRRKPVSLASRR